MSSVIGKDSRVRKSVASPPASSCGELMKMRPRAASTTRPDLAGLSIVKEYLCHSYVGVTVLSWSPPIFITATSLLPGLSVFSHTLKVLLPLGAPVMQLAK